MKNVTLDDLEPSKLKDLTDEQLATLRELSDEDIKAAADRYPNKPTSNNYLVLEDTRKGAKQLFNTSSWKNLADLRGPLNQKFWVVKTIKSKLTAGGPKVEAKTQVAKDITKDEIAGADGLQKIAEKQNAIPGAQPDGAKDEIKKDDVVIGDGKVINMDADKKDGAGNNQDLSEEKVIVDPNKTDEFSETDVDQLSEEELMNLKVDQSGNNQDLSAGSGKQGKNKNK